jgi:hypothetical protein
MMVLSMVTWMEYLKLVELKDFAMGMLMEYLKVNLMEL